MAFVVRPDRGACGALGPSRGGSRSPAGGLGAADKRFPRSPPSYFAAMPHFQALGLRLIQEQRTLCVWCACATRISRNPSTPSLSLGHVVAHWFEEPPPTRWEKRLMLGARVGWGLSVRLVLVLKPPRPSQAEADLRPSAVTTTCSHQEM